jgi:hypothetical protein
MVHGTWIYPEGLTAMTPEARKLTHALYGVSC